MAQYDIKLETFPRTKMFVYLNLENVCEIAVLSAALLINQNVFIFALIVLQLTSISIVLKVESTK